MYFYLSKTLGDLGVPSNFIFLLIVCGLILWRSRFARFGRSVTVVGILLWLICGLTPIGTALLVPLENRFPRPPETTAAPTGIVVLGGVVNNYISLMRHDIALEFVGWPADRGGLSAEALSATAGHIQRRQFQSHFQGASRIPSSPRGSSKSSACRRIISPSMTVHGTPWRTPLTPEKIADARPGERWLLVTSALHMPRAMSLFRAAGFPIEAYPVDYRTGGWRELMALPSLSLLGGFSRLDPAVHEWEGLIVDRLVGRSGELFPSPAGGPE